MDVFFTGLIVLLAFLAIFFVVFFSFVVYWHLKKESIFVVPFMFAFEVFWKCFLWLVVISLIFYYAPFIINYLAI